MKMNEKDISNYVRKSAAVKRKSQQHTIVQISFERTFESECPELAKWLFHIVTLLKTRIFNDIERNRANVELSK